MIFIIGLISSVVSLILFAASFNMGYFEQQEFRKRLVWLYLVEAIIGFSICVIQPLYFDDLRSWIVVICILGIVDTTLVLKRW